MTTRTKGLVAMGSMEKTVRLILLSLLLPAFCVATAWADVSDPCDGGFGPGSYQNLAPPDRDYIGWNAPPDSSYLCQQSNRRTASVVYRCSDAREVTVAIYSRHGCWAVYDGGQLVRGGDELPLWYQPSTGEVYCDGRRMVYDAQLREFAFLEEEGDPSGLVEYGLSVYGSTDGINYERVAVRLVSAWREGPGAYWYEVYRADLKEGTGYLRLELTDQSSIEIPGREERYQFETVGGLSLASVTIVEEEPSQVSDPKKDESSSQYVDDDDDWDDRYDWGYWDDWEEDWGVWEEGELEPVQGRTDSLPAYQPGEEEGPASLPWGPEEDIRDNRPAFPEETGDDEREPEKSFSENRSSSSGGSQTASSKSQSQQKKSAAPKEQSEAAREAPEGSAGPAQAVTAAPVLRREVPLWQRIMEPDAMSMMLLSFTLIAMGIRVLWNSGNDRRGGIGKSEEEARQEARYARYTDPVRDDDLWKGPEDR